MSVKSVETLAYLPFASDKTAVYLLGVAFVKLSLSLLYVQSSPSTVTCGSKSFGTSLIRQLVEPSVT